MDCDGASVAVTVGPARNKSCDPLLFEINDLLLSRKAYGENSNKERDDEYERELSADRRRYQ
jgi:hypothetical protein